VKLIIQIPCFNEEESLPVALAQLPRQVPGVDVVEWLIIDDGSKDKTREVAKAHGVDHIVGFPKNRGLARGFMLGIRSCHIVADLQSVNRRLLEELLEEQRLRRRVEPRGEHSSRVPAALPSSSAQVVPVSSSPSSQSRAV
jgi:glycosyltransferase involved in cell wall biosynthesis